MINVRKIKWFRLNRELHRDLGYLAVGLTLVFAVSGIALNHMHDWNPNYIIKKQLTQLPPPYVDLDEDQLKQKIVDHLRLAQPVIASYWQSKQVYKVFFEGGSHGALDLTTGLVMYESVSTRHVFRQFNALHINELKGSWIAFSDIYAGVLIFLAVSGLFMVKGRNSPLRPRGLSLLTVGMFIPLVYILLL